MQSVYQRLNNVGKRNAERETYLERVELRAAQKACQQVPIGMMMHFHTCIRVTAGSVSTRSQSVKQEQRTKDGVLLAVLIPGVRSNQRAKVVVLDLVLVAMKRINFATMAEGKKRTTGPRQRTSR